VERLRQADRPRQADPRGSGREPRVDIRIARADQRRLRVDQLISNFLLRAF